jgi:hypothetical protein
VADLDLGRRTLAVGLEWAPGMRVVDPSIIRGGAPRPGRIVLDAERGTLRVTWEDGAYWRPTPTEWDVYVPDLDDPATQGCMLAQVRSRIGADSPDEHYDAWRVLLDAIDCGRHVAGSIVLALEATHRA